MLKTLELTDDVDSPNPPAPRRAHRACADGTHCVVETCSTARIYAPGSKGASQYRRAAILCKKALRGASIDRAVEISEWGGIQRPRQVVLTTISRIEGATYTCSGAHKRHTGNLLVAAVNHRPATYAAPNGQRADQRDVVCPGRDPHSADDDRGAPPVVVCASPRSAV